jgi:hypothetical protein
MTEIDERQARADDEFAIAFNNYLDAYRKEGNKFLMVLNDGETFTGLGGCSIIRCPDQWETDAIEHALKEGNGWEDIDEAEGREPVEDDPRDNLVVLVVFGG